MTKQGGRVKSWKKRWLVLTSDALVYYKAEGGEKKGDIPLSDCGSVRAALHKKNTPCFKVVTAWREFLFCTDTEEDMRQWIDAISSARRRIVGDETSFEANRRVRLEDFKIMRVVGKGSFGKVLQVRYIPTGKILAMKVLNKKTVIDKDEVASTRAEKSILMKLRSPFLVRLHSSFQTIDKLYFVMDYVNGGELFFHLQRERKFSPERVRFYAAEIALGVEYLHKRGIIYRDLKPENILIRADGHVCMTDFGISKEGLVAKDDRTATFCGTPEYLAPEVLKGDRYGKEIDWWSLGTLMFEMLTSMPPFYTEDVQEMYQKIMTEELDFSGVPDADTRSVISGFLTRDPSKRLADPDKIKAHPYFSCYDWKKLAALEITPPWVPPVSGAEDTSQFDETFTGEDPALSLPVQSELSTTQQENFKDFTFVSNALPTAADEVSIDDDN